MPRFFLPLLFVFLPVYLSAGSECLRVFPDVFSAAAGIDVRSGGRLEATGATLETPKITGRAALLHCGSHLCAASQNAPQTLPAFVFEQTPRTDTLEIAVDTTLKDENLSDIVITEPGVTVTFSAPPSKGGRPPLQRIGTITDETGSATLRFEAGDYHIAAIRVKALRRLPPRIAPAFAVEPEAQARLFLHKGMTVSQNTFAPQRLALNPEPKTVMKPKTFFGVIPNGFARKRVSAEPKDLLLYSQGKIMIDIRGKMSGAAYLYGYDDVSIASAASSRFEGAVHADGTLHLGRSMPPMMPAGTFGYREPEALYALRLCRALPDLPDPDENGRTLLGIDANRNGVRDDLEYYIVERFGSDSEYPKTKTAIALQYAAAASGTLVDPDNAYKNRTDIAMDRAMDCDWYWMEAKKIPYEEGDILDHEFDDRIFNTKKRLINYARYNGALGGHAFVLTEANISSCAIHIDELGEW
jgi:hypothetical protein